MASDRGQPRVEVRETPLKDGSITSTYTVRWWTLSDGRRRKTFKTELFVLELRRLQLEGGSDDGDRGSMTLDTFWARYYLADLLQRIEPETVKGHDELYDRYVRETRNPAGAKAKRPVRPKVDKVQRLGSLTLSELTTRKVSLLSTALLTAGVGQETVRRVLLLLQGMCRYAVELEEIPVNPVREVRKPRQRASKVVHPIEPANVELIRSVFFQSGDLWSWALVGALAYAGPRPGEPQAWEERHIRERTILIEQAVRNGRVKVQKTGRAFRAIDLLDLLREDLRFYCARTGPLPQHRLFANNAGEWLSTHDWQNWRRRQFAKAVRSVGLPPMRPYDLRHAFASLLIREQRYSIVEIAEQLGHSGTMTLNVYGHVFAEFRGAPPIAASELLATARRKVPGAGPIWPA